MNHWRVDMTSICEKKYILWDQFVNKIFQCGFSDRLRHRFAWICERMQQAMYSLQWRYNGRDGVSNHQPDDCILNRLFRRRSKKASKFRVTGLCAGNSPVTGEFPARRSSNGEMLPFGGVIMLVEKVKQASSIESIYVWPWIPRACDTDGIWNEKNIKTV